MVMRSADGSPVRGAYRTSPLGGRFSIRCLFITAKLLKLANFGSKYFDAIDGDARLFACNTIDQRLTEIR